MRRKPVPSLRVYSVNERNRVRHIHLKKRKVMNFHDASSNIAPKNVPDACEDTCLSATYEYHSSKHKNRPMRHDPSLPATSHRSRLPSPESRVPSPESQAPSPKPRVPSPESPAPSPESRVPSPESRVPSPQPRVPSPQPHFKVAFQVGRPTNAESPSGSRSTERGTRNFQAGALLGSSILHDSGTEIEAPF
jgi:hypothetical protein